MFVPAAAPAPRFQPAPWNSKGSQKGGASARNFVAKGGFAKGGFKKGSGKGGKALTDQQIKAKAGLDKLGKIEAERKVWVGGLGEDVTRRKLEEHFKSGSCKPSQMELMSKGTACLAFKDAETAETAIGSLNGSELDGIEIQVDVWTKKERPERKEGEQRPKKTKPVINQTLKNAAKGKGKGGKQELSKLALKIKAIDHSLKVWVGGLSAETTWKELKAHFNDLGAEVHMCDLMKKGTACVTFKTEEEVATAISIVNGTDLAGQAVTVDVWTKPERREKKKKEEA